MVGVNRFSDSAGSGAGSSAPIQRVDPAQERQRLAAFKAARDNPAAHLTVQRVGQAAALEQKIMPAVIGALDLSATLGEISGRLLAV